MARDINFNTVERKIYPRTFLNSIFVFFQIDSTCYPVDYIEKIHTYIKDNFNLPIDISEKEMSNGGFCIDSKDEGHSYYFSRNSIGVKYVRPDYVSFSETMLPLVYRLVSFAKNVLAISSIDKMKIRKVNVLNAVGQGERVISESNLEHELLSEQLINAAEPVENYYELSNVKTINGITGGDSFEIYYGFRSGTTKEGNDYLGLLLDESISKDSVEINSVDEKLKEINDKLFNMFHWSVSPNMLAIMNKEL